jgi:hypothetical protein
MGILRVHSKAKTKFIGHNVPDDVYEYFSLYAVANGVTKSAMFLELVTDWINNHREADEVLLNKIVSNLKHTFKHKRIKVEIQEFKDMVKEELLNKGINKSYVEQILNKLK